MVHTQLAAMRSKKKFCLLTTIQIIVVICSNLDNKNDRDNNELIVPETQTQIVDATHYGSTESIDDKDQLPEDCKASELEKTPVLSSLTTGEKITQKACRITTTPPSKNKIGANESSFVPSQIEILKYGYKTPTKIPFELLEKLQVSLTRFTPTPKLDAWFVDDGHQFCCLVLIQTLHELPV